MININWMQFTKIRSIFQCILIFVVLSSCSGKSCQELPSNFSTYNEAKTKVRTSSGYVIKQKRSLESSWIKSTEFYSCDGKNGFLIITTNRGKTYIHNLVPEKVAKTV